MKQYMATWVLPDRTPVIVRSIRPEDETLMVRFHESLSAESVYLRYFHVITLSQRTAHERLVRICCNDDDRELALVAEGRDAASGERRIMAVGQLSKLRGRDEAELALLVVDAYQGQGLGTELLRRLVQIGREAGLDRLSAAILPDNYHMQHIVKRVGFRLRHQIDEGVVEAELAL